VRRHVIVVTCRRSKTDKPVVHVGARAVEVGIVDRLPRDSRVRQRQLDGPHGLGQVGRNLHAVVRVARRRVPGQLREDRRAACQRVLSLFQDEHPRPFPEHEPVAVE